MSGGVVLGELKGGWGLSERARERERCIHETRGGFHFCVKSRYQTGAGYASRGEGRQEEEGPRDRRGRNVPGPRALTYPGHGKKYKTY